MKEEKQEKLIQSPERLMSYFRKEVMSLTIVTVSGLIYNIGLTAGPYFEGQMAQKLYDIMKGDSDLSEMIVLAMMYVVVILLVQTARCLKRFFVRRFANNTSRNMRHVLYNHLVHQSKKSLEQESVGTLMTKAISDVDACVEGMRKFTTEVFDTGIALMSYLVMMFIYDWRLALLASVFTPVAYIIAEKIKVLVYRYTSAYKKSASALNDATMERVRGAMTYRVFGQEASRDTSYETYLSNYEQSAVMANIWENTLQPIYNIIAMTGVIVILYFGGKNVMGTGYRAWDIAAFTAFLSCFAKMALKSSKAAKLFNAVQKAQVSWKRIKPLMTAAETVDETTNLDFDKPVRLNVKDFAVGYNSEQKVFEGLSFEAEPGDIIGITGPVACGKSTLGRAFLCENPYEGSITLNERELRTFSEYERHHLISYLGHQPELMGDSIAKNISYGEEKEVNSVIQAVCMDKDISEMAEGIYTEIGSSGTRLSGGQQDRLALARTLYHARNVLILDDPFSAVDAITEHRIIEDLRNLIPNAVILIFSHRVTQFPDFTKVIWMQDGRCVVGNHEQVYTSEKTYARIYDAQQAGGDLDE